MVNPHENPQQEVDSLETRNMTDYEREKIEKTLNEVKSLGGLIEKYLKMIEFCDEKDILLKNRESLDKVRLPGEVAGSDSNLDKLIRVFANGQSEIQNNIHVDFKEELERKLSEVNDLKKNIDTGIKPEKTVETDKDDMDIVDILGNVNGYDEALGLKERDIIEIRGDGVPTLRVGMVVKITDDAQGLLGVEPGQEVAITGFVSPSKEETDHIVEVYNGKNKTKVKPSQIDIGK